MKLTILGSGGYVRIPRACCSCKVCVEARLKKSPYERLASAIFLHDINTLFEASEDVNTELNNHKIKQVDNILFSHWHPDHAAGLRIIESLRVSKQLPPIQVILTESLINDFQKRNPALFFFETLNYCKINKTDSFTKDGINISLVRLNNNFSYAFVIKKESKKVIYCPCHCMDLPILPELMNADVLIMNLGSFDNDSKNITTFEKDNLRLVEMLNPKKTILTHIEELWGKNYDDYCELEKKYSAQNIVFAFDGMEINL